MFVYVFKCSSFGHTLQHLLKSASDAPVGSDTLSSLRRNGDPMTFHSAMPQADLDSFDAPTVFLG